MRPREHLRLRIVTLIEPSLCGDCCFASTADVEMEDGTTRPMFHCKRRDCDNWQTKPDTVAPSGIRETT